jgi:hypothetical protein
MEYRVWYCSPVNNACSLALIEGYERSYELIDGVSLAAVFPKKACARMDSDFKKATRLTDDLSNMNDVKVCSKRLVEFLQENKVQHLEYLPLTIINHKGKVASTDYFVVNPVGLVDALDLEASKPIYNAIRKERISRVDQIVLDPRRLDPGRKVFRLKGLVDPVLIEKDLADGMEAAGMVGPFFNELESYDS